ncbi:MAG: Holliday junction branch migration protein RuvA [Pseudomonadota bacterium]
MIGRLTGTVDAIGESHCIIDVGGVGYEVQASARTLRAIIHGERVSLTIDTHVREDAIRLFGFASEHERTWFRTLQGVQGVGAKVALACLGILSPQELSNAIALGDWTSIERTPGVGKKLAQRIASELKDKAPTLAAGIGPAGEAASGSGAAAGAVGSPTDADATVAAEAISALTNLGYQPVQAGQAVAAAMATRGEDADVATLIRDGLKSLAN